MPAACFGIPTAHAVSTNAGPSVKLTLVVKEIDACTEFRVWLSPDGKAVLGAVGLDIELDHLSLRPEPRVVDIHESSARYDAPVLICCFKDRAEVLSLIVPKIKDGGKRNMGSMRWCLFGSQKKRIEYENGGQNEIQAPVM